MADAAEVVSAIERVPGVTYSAIVPNVKGAQRGIDAGLDELQIFLSASETHNHKNVNMSVEESLVAAANSAAVIRAANIPFDAVVATAFGCPYEGDVDPLRVLDIASSLLDMGASRITLGDTTGMAYPMQVYAMVKAFYDRFGPLLDLNLHFHNTRGLGLANVLAAMEAGVASFDASLGGLGGCPFAPGATGNICTEDLVHMLDCMGIETGVDLNALLEVAQIAQGFINDELPGQVLRAGPRLRLYDVNVGKVASATA